MVGRAIYLATEDALSEAVGTRLIDEFPGRICVGKFIRRNGNGYLRSRLSNFIAMARTAPVLVITDLDRVPCAGALCVHWLGQARPPAELLLRVAVREIESWLLADAEAIGMLLGKRAQGRVPDDTDAIGDPKQFLLRLASSAPRGVREDLCQDRRGIASQGLGYNARLGHFVKNTWNPARAATRSESLRRARRRIRGLAAAGGDRPVATS